MVIHFSREQHASLITGNYRRTTQPCLLHDRPWCCRPARHEEGSKKLMIAHCNRTNGAWHKLRSRP